MYSSKSIGWVQAITFYRTIYVGSMIGKMAATEFYECVFVKLAGYSTLPQNASVSDFRACLYDINQDVCRKLVVTHWQLGS